MISTCPFQFKRFYDSSFAAFNAPCCFDHQNAQEVTTSHEDFVAKTCRHQAADAWSVKSYPTKHISIRHLRREIKLILLTAKEKQIHGQEGTMRGWPHSLPK